VSTLSEGDRVVAVGDDIVEGGREIRPHLQDLLGADAVVVEQNLGNLLALADVGQDVSAAVAMLLRQREPTKDWMRAFLQERRPPEVEKLYQPLPGDEAPVAALKYVCPTGHFEWFVSKVGEQIPRCPIDNLSLVPQ
jgi:hypothetical protein